MRWFVAIVGSLLLIGTSALAQPRTTPPASNGQWPPLDATPVISSDRLPIPETERPAPPQCPDLAWLTPPDEHRLWFTADLLLWWVKSAPLPQPLVTMGSARDSIPGAPGQPHTSVLFGQNNVGFGPASGVRLGVGGWFDAEYHWAAELNGFLLAEKQHRKMYESDGDNGIALAQPIVIPGHGESAYDASLGGLTAGKFLVSTSTQFGGWELNGLRNLYRSDNLEFNLLGGFREVVLHETLMVNSDTIQRQPNVLSFAGQPLGNVGDQISVGDRFRATTDFYGPQIGGKLSWTSNRFGIDFIGKVAMGVGHETVSINGATWLLPAANNSMTVMPGGILAQSSNIGYYSRDVFAVVPEADLNFHYDLAPWARLSLGGSFIYLSRAVRPGLVVDRNVEPGQVPSNPLFGQGSSGNSPTFLFRDSGYWAQGLNFGITIRY